MADPHRAADASPRGKADLDATWRIRRLDAVNQWITAAPTDRESYRTLFEDPGRLAKTLLIELDGLVIGDLMLSIEDAWAQTEVAAQARVCRRSSAGAWTPSRPAVATRPRRSRR